MQRRELFTINCICCTPRRSALTASAQISISECLLYGSKPRPCAMCVSSPRSICSCIARKLCCRQAKLKVSHTISTIVACQLRLLLIVSNLCRCSHQGMNREPGEAMAAALLTAIRACARCRKNASEDGLMAGHDCLLYLISIGKDPRQYAVYCL